MAYPCMAIITLTRRAQEKNHGLGAYGRIGAYGRKGLPWSLPVGRDRGFEVLRSEAHLCKPRHNEGEQSERSPRAIGSQDRKNDHEICSPQPGAQKGSGQSFEWTDRP